MFVSKIGQQDYYQLDLIFWRSMFSWELIWQFDKHKTVFSLYSQSESIWKEDEYYHAAYSVPKTLKQIWH